MSKLSEDIENFNREKYGNKKRRFLLAIDNDLWSRFIKTILLSSNPTEKITQLIHDWIIQYEAAGAKAGEHQAEPDEKKQQ